MSLFKRKIMIPAGVFGLCLWGFLLYWNTFQSPFVFDDKEFVLENPAIRQDSVRELWRDLNYRKRFVAFASFALNYRVHGNDVTGYHVVNTAIHLSAALSVVWFLLLLLNAPRMREERITRHKYVIAFLVGALFVSHPIQTQAVTYISQRFECLAALFYMLSLCFYLKGRMNVEERRKTVVSFTLSGAMAILGAFTKETVFTLPGAIFLIEWIFFRRAAAIIEAKERKTFWQKPWVYAGLVFALMAAAFLFISLDLRKIFEAHSRMGIPSGTYFCTQLNVILQYIRMLVLPVGQTLDHDVAWVSGFWNGPTIASTFTILMILVLAVRSIRRFPLIGSGVLWFFLTLSVTSSFIPLKDAMMEHRLYLPSVGFFIALAAGLYGAIKNFRFFLFGMIGVILFFSFLTYQRNSVWADEVGFWEDVVGKAPQKARPYQNLGSAYQARGEYPKAIAAYQKAVQLHRGSPEPLSLIYNNLGAVYGKTGKTGEEISFYRKAIELDPKNYRAYSNLGYALAASGKYQEAIRYGERAVKLAPTYDEGWNNLGVTYGRMGQYPKAMAMFQKALKLNPYYEDARSNLALAGERLAKGKAL